MLGGASSAGGGIWAASTAARTSAATAGRAGGGEAFWDGAGRGVGWVASLAALRAGWGRGPGPCQAQFAPRSGTRRPWWPAAASLAFFGACWSILAAVFLAFLGAAAGRVGMPGRRPWKGGAIWLAGEPVALVLVGAMVVGATWYSTSRVVWGVDGGEVAKGKPLPLGPRRRRPRTAFPC